MSEDRPPGWRKPNTPPAWVPLQYERPRSPVDDDGPAGGVSFGGQIALGFGAFVLCGAIGLGMLRVPMATSLFDIFTPLLALLLLIAVTVVARVNWRWRGFVVGVLIGVGLVGLAAGACFAIVFSKGF